MRPFYVSDRFIIIWSSILLIIMMTFIGWFSFNMGYQTGQKKQLEKIEQYKKAIAILKNRNKSLRDRLSK